MTEQPEDKFIMLKLTSTPMVTIAKLIEETDHALLVEYPVNVAIQHIEDGEIEIVSSKYMPFATNDRVLLQKVSIFGVSEPSLDMINYYISFRSQCGSQIEESFAEFVDEWTNDGRGASNVPASMDDSVPEGSVFH